MPKRLLITTVALIATFIAFAQEPSLPAIKKQGSIAQFYLSNKPFLILGAQLWNSSGWPYLLEKEWPQLKELGANTVEVPVYWQQIEEEKGKFNFKQLDSIISGARKHNLKLILLWFGSYKNGSSQYAPAWLLSDTKTYPRMLNAGGSEIQVLSAVSENNIHADITAFTALMEHLKSADRQEQTVIMVQVENECGSLGTDRDYSDAATAAFKKYKGTAEEFQAESFSKYLERVAKAGRAVYNLPLYTNVWVKEHNFKRPGEYPSGGPTANVLEIWKKNAPSLELIALDLYSNYAPNFHALCSAYTRTDNPLFIPETGRGTDFARFQFYAFANYKAIGVAPYGIDPFHADPHDQRNKERLDDKFKDIAANFRLFGAAMQPILKAQRENKIVAGAQEPHIREQALELGDYDILLQYGFPTYKDPSKLTGRAMILQIAADEFIILGMDTKFAFRPRTNTGYGSAEIINVEEGTYENEKWVRKRFWNGDEVYHSTLLPEGVILKIRLRKMAAAAKGSAKANFEQ
jgi:FMN-dependent NADH-azoreductase